jgi:hypothetical protein
MLLVGMRFHLIHLQIADVGDANLELMVVMMMMQMKRDWWHGSEEWQSKEGLMEVHVERSS